MPLDIIRGMRRYHAIPFVVAALSLAAFSDTIYLKNGSVIEADSTHAVSDRIEYQVGENTFSIPQAIVLRVVSLSPVLQGGPAICPKTRGESVAAHPRSPHSTARVPLSPEILCKQFGPKRTDVKDWMENCENMMANGGVQQDALLAIETQCRAPLSAEAFYTAANFDYAGNEDEGALEYLKVSLSNSPEHADALTLMPIVLERLHRYSDEVKYAEEAVRVLGPEHLGMLGRAYYMAGNEADAIRVWKLYTAVNRNANVQVLQQNAQQARERDRVSRREWPDPEQE